MSRKLIARRYEAHGRLAVEPQAFLELFYLPDEPAENRIVGDCAVVDIKGPLSSTRDGWYDSYEAILERAAAACSSEARNVLLNLDTPGGDASGCFECARELRVMCAAAKKPLLAYAERANSAGYALASAASSITVGETATAGSIGVISVRADYSAINTARGLRVAFITSGARKADGHPDNPLTDEEIEAEQGIVDDLAGLFFQLVADHRSVKPAAIEALQARVLLGRGAVKAGLADQVGSFKSAVARAAAAPAAVRSVRSKLARVASAQTTVRKTMTVKLSKLTDAVAELEEIAAGDGEDAATAAAMLAAAAGSDSDEDEDKESAEGDDDDKEKSSESAEDDDEDEDKKSAKDEDEDEESAETTAPAPAANASAKSIALSALAEAHKANAKLAKRELNDERERLLATRKDFSPQMLTALRDAPLKTVREMVKTLPKGPVSKAAKVEKTQRAATRGQDAKGHAQGSQAGSSTTPREDIELMERKMGLSAAPNEVEGVKRTAHKLTFGTPATVKPKSDTPPATN